MQKPRHWIIQTSGRIADAEEKRIVTALDKLGIQRFSIGVIPFTNEITGVENIPDEPGFLHCSTKIVHILTSGISAVEVFPSLPVELAQHKLKVLKSSLYYDPQKFDQAVYCKLPEFISKKVLLNHDARIMKIGGLLNEELPYDVFIKPSSDLKLFKGGVFEAGYTLSQQIIANGMVDTKFFDAKDDLIVLAQVKEIGREWRFFVVNSEVITGSQYMNHGNVVPDPYIPNNILEQARSWAKQYTPAEAFVVDLCELKSGELHIVEYNCINASGTYLADIEQLALALTIDV